MQLTIGKFRGLQQCSSEKGTFTCLALDHRQNLRKALNPYNPGTVNDAELTHFKLDVTASLASSSTAVLLDPEFGAAQAVASGALPGHIPIVVALEATGYGGEPTARHSQILPGWSVEKAKRMGASLVKLLVYYHPDSPTAREIEAFVKQVADECLHMDIGLMLEPLSYPLSPGGRLASEEKRYVVTETARRLTPLGVDLLKAEFPLDASEITQEAEWVQACRQVSSLSQAPWIVLSAAVDFDTYLHQVRSACYAGASGCAVGRAVWQEAVRMDGDARAALLKEVALPRLKALSEICDEFGKPWMDFYSPPLITPNWYKTY
jgi:tagatose 1,6-diphosphate aldolase